MSLPPPLVDDFISSGPPPSSQQQQNFNNNKTDNENPEEDSLLLSNQSSNNNNNKEYDINSATTGTTRAQRHFARLCSILTDPSVDIDTVRLTLRRGVPDELRMDFWRLALGVVPLGHASKREEAQKQMQEQYQQLLELTCADIKDGGEAEEGVDPFPIDADIPRTMPTLHFFASPSHHNTTIAQQAAAASSNNKNKNEAKSSNHTNENHHSNQVSSSAAVKFNKIAPSAQNPEGAFGGEPESENQNNNNANSENENDQQQQKERDTAFDPSLTNTTSSTATTSIASPASPSKKSSPFAGMTFTPSQLALRRVLFLFSRVHRGRSYAQGMNEMVGLLLWAACNGDASQVNSVEADVFFCFQSLMQWCGDHFCSIPDHEGESGLSHTLRSFSFLLEMCDPELAHHLEKKFMIVPEFYAFRWISILFVLEFPVADVLSLWDFMLSFTDRVSVAAQFVAVAMLVNVRERLLELDVSSCIEMLQGYPPIDVNDIIATAQALIDRHTVMSHLWNVSSRKNSSEDENDGENNNNSSSQASPSSTRANTMGTTRRHDTDSDSDSDVGKKIVDGANAAMNWLSSKANSLFNKDK